MTSKNQYIINISQIMFRFLLKVDIHTMPIKEFTKVVQSLDAMVQSSDLLDISVLEFFFECIDLYRNNVFTITNRRNGRFEAYMIKVVTDILEHESIHETNAFFLYNKYIQHAKSMLINNDIDVKNMNMHSSYYEYDKLINMFIKYPFTISERLTAIELGAAAPIYKSEIRNALDMMSYTTKYIDSVNDYIIELRAQVNSYDLMLKSIAKRINTNNIEDWIISYMESTKKQIESLVANGSSMNDYIVDINSALRGCDMSNSSAKDVGLAVCFAREVDKMYNNRDGLNNVLGWVRSIDGNLQITDNFINSMNKMYGLPKHNDYVSGFNGIHEIASQHTKFERSVLKAVGYVDNKLVVDRIDMLVSLENNVADLMIRGDTPADSTTSSMYEKTGVFHVIKDVRDIMEMVDAKTISVAKRRIKSLMRMARVVYAALYADNRKFDMDDVPNMIVSDMKEYDKALNVLANRDPNKDGPGKYTLGMFVEIIETLSGVRSSLNELRRPEDTSDYPLVAIVNDVSTLVSNAKTNVAAIDYTPALAIEGVPGESNQVDDISRKRKKIK